MPRSCRTASASSATFSATGEQPDGQEPETDHCRGGRPLLVMPWGYEPRIVAQHGAFIMTSLDGSLADSNLFMS